MTCAHGWQEGGGLYIDKGTVMLTDTNVYKNRAIEVRSPVEPSSSPHPAGRCSVTCAHGWQLGGGFFIDGTATLTNNKVYENHAGQVSLAVEPSLSAHPAPHALERDVYVTRAMVGSMARGSLSWALQR